MAFRDRLRRLRRASRDDMVAIPQRDGTVKRFPKSALREAFLEDVDRTLGRVGSEVPTHPLLVALHNSDDPMRTGGWFMSGGDPPDLEAVEDLSEDT